MHRPPTGAAENYTPRLWAALTPPTPRQETAAGPRKVTLQTDSRAPAAFRDPAFRYTDTGTPQDEPGAGAGGNCCCSVGISYR
jgi:hypothetical protein